MEVKTFRADNMFEALQLVRRQLGPDAAVLRTREVSGGLVRWLLGRPQVEIAATRELAETAVPAAMAAPPTKSAAARRGPLPMGDAGLDLESLLTQSLRDANHARIAPSSANATESATLPECLSQCLSGVVSPDRLAWLCEVLQHHLPHDEDRPQGIAVAQLRAALARALPVRQPAAVFAGQQVRLALIGPTGVGKTTTLAKLAADYSLRQCLRVGLITTDIYRIGAVDQLRAYAEILSIPLEVVAHADEVSSALARLSDVDIVLIDTAGLCLQEGETHAEVRQVLAAAKCHEVFAVLNASGELGWLERASRRLKQLGANSLIFSKLDDVSQPGGLLPLLLAGELPLSYVACGQRVPDDLEPACGVKMAERILG